MFITQTQATLLKSKTKTVFITQGSIASLLTWMLAAGRRCKQWPSTTVASLGEAKLHLGLRRVVNRFTSTQT
ncbi:hypothetical protein YC2023_077593 [Brassica napus]